MLSCDITTIQSSEITNSGTLAGKNLLAISAENITNRFGKMTADNTLVSAEQDLVNIGGAIEAAQILNVNAGRDIVVNTTAHRTQNANGETVTLGTRGGFYLTGKDGRQMWVNAGRDINLTAGEIINNAQNALTAIQAGRDILLNVGQQSDRYENIRDAENYLKTANRRDIGTTISSQGSGKTVLQAGRNIEAKAAAVSAGGDVLLNAGNHVTLSSGEEYHYVDSAFKDTGRGFLNKTTTKTRDISEQTFAIGSQLDGNNVDIFTQQGDVNIIGSDVVAENELNVAAKNINIAAATNQVYSENLKQVKKSGLMGSGGIGFTIGSRKETTENDQVQLSARQSQVGSLKGNTTVQAGNHYQQTGSIVSAGKGDVDIQAQSVNISAARADYESNYKYTMEQKGVTIALTGAVAAAIQAVDSTTKSVKAMGSSKNDRVNALGAVNAGFEAMRAAGQLQEIAQAASNGSPTGGAVGVSITYGQQKSEQTQHTEGNTAEKSQVNAGSKVNITAQGKGEQSHITLKGADVSGQAGTHLKAEGDVNILAIDENHLERSKNKSFGFNVGVAIQIGNGIAAGITAGGNVAKGYGNGDSQAWVASTLGSENSQTTIESGNDTNIIGSQVKGKRVEVNAENLNIESLQDTARYEGKQESVSGQVTVGWGGASVSGSYSKSKVSSNYASVKTQAGIYAGDEGYDVHVNNHTELTGGLVTSTDKAEVEGKNRFSTGTLNATDIQNQAETSGSAYKVSGSADINGGWTGDKKEALSAAIGYGEVDENQTATTKSGINTANIDIRDKQTQVAKTGQTAEDMLTQVKTEISTDTATQNSGVLENHFDKDTVQKELDYQVKVTGEFQEITLPEIDRQMANKAAEYRKEEKILRQAGNEQAANEMAANAEKWEMGGEYKQRVDAIANAVGLALGGVGVEGTLAGAASPYINEAIKAQLPEDKNKAANVIAHVIWGAVEAKLQGASATTGALSTAVGELSAPIVSEVLYGTSDPNLLTEEQKQFVSDLSRIAATATGAISSRAEGNRSVQVAKDAVTSGKVAENAVENNLFGTVINNPQTNWQAVAEGEKIKRERDEEIRAYIKKEHPVIYQTAEGAHYFMSATGKAIYVAREMVIELAPMVIAPEIAAGTKVYAAVSRIALSGGANVVAQKVSGQEFNWAEFGGAIASGYISPHLKTTKDIVRVNAGIGMATGLANGSDGLSDAVLSGAAAYGATKTSNPLWSSVVSEVIQKIPNIRDSIRNEEYKNEK